MRVPQVDGNPTLRRAILAGRVSQRDAIQLERACLKALRAFDGSKASHEAALTALAEYEVLCQTKKSYIAEYDRTLTAAPWTTCAAPCAANSASRSPSSEAPSATSGAGFTTCRCSQRRWSNYPSGPHEGAPVADRYDIRLPAIRIRQGSHFIYCFGVDGKRIHDFAAVSRVHRDDDSLQGYQRPEVLTHIKAIRRYLESEGAMLPNAVVLAFDERVTFEPAIGRRQLGLHRHWRTRDPCRRVAR